MARAETWRTYLIGDNELIETNRKLYHTIIATFPYNISQKEESCIERDIPRTRIVGCNCVGFQKNIQTILCQYVQIMPCDGYLQGFNYLVSVLYHVYSKADEEYASSDSWWSLLSIISIIRPMIPDHDPDDFAIYTERWSKHYVSYLQSNAPRTHSLLKPFYNTILPILTVKWLMIWFTQLFPISDVMIIWDALITCEPNYRMKLMAIIAANVTIQHSASIENWALIYPNEIGPRLLSVKASDGAVIVDSSRNAMLHYKIPGI